MFGSLLSCSGQLETLVFGIVAVCLIVAGSLFVHVSTVDMKGDSATDAEKEARPKELLSAHSMILVAGVAFGIKLLCEYYSNSGLSSTSSGLSSSLSRDQLAAIAAALRR